MKRFQIIAANLVALAVLSGCNTAPHNAQLTDAHSNYHDAQNSPQVTERAAPELKTAGDSLSKADIALNQGESAEMVNQLAYIANQQVTVARETARSDSLRTDTAILEADKRNDSARAARQTKQLRTLKAKKTKRGMVVTLADVLFDTDDANLTPAGKLRVTRLADMLKEHAHLKVMIEGYTDSTGNELRNKKLSERRANAVRIALIERGVASDRVSSRGFGQAFPVAGNAMAASRQFNRRVEIIISDRNGNIAKR
jgi:outer membrane protein OmpA-like peptidoglycan-associated protein